MKRVVVCCDGTWNVADPADGAPTNVVKLALQVAPSDGAGVEQRTYYHSGVGTSRWSRLVGGAFGVGLSALVQDAYRFVVTVWEPGDELFLFGFSRGAFTARSLAGLIRNAGVLRPENAARIDEAYRLYRSRRLSDDPEERAAVLFRAAWSWEAEVRCIGVFDTVGALGVPFTGNAFGRWVNRAWAFHDTTLGPHVRSAFHALAIDERRRPFIPSLWVEQAPDQHVEQVWFRGVHGDVGGGYPDSELSDVALRWMSGRAHDCGLVLRSRDGDISVPTPRPDPGAGVHDSGTGFWRLVLAPRVFGGEDGKPRPGEAVASIAVGAADLPPTFVDAAPVVGIDLG